MKKIIFILICLLFPLYAMAAGTVSFTVYSMSQDGNQMVIEAVCVGDCDNATAANREINLTNLKDSSGNSVGEAYAYWKKGYWLTEIVTIGAIADESNCLALDIPFGCCTAKDAGACDALAPDAADVTLYDRQDNLVYDEDNVITASGGIGEGTISVYKQVNSPLTLLVANQDTANAQYNIYIKLSK